MATLFGATYPERVTAIILCVGAARYTRRLRSSMRSPTGRRRPRAQRSVTVHTITAAAADASSSSDLVPDSLRLRRIESTTAAPATRYAQ